MENNDLILALEDTGYGLCRKCNRPVEVTTLEVTHSAVDKEGNPITSRSSLEYYFVCHYCDYTESAEWDSAEMRYIPKNPALQYLNRMKAEQIANRYPKRYDVSVIVEE